mmetsp:Transcript_60340/g.141185  ORF Transcript_60340/g.141185 Transcript_60340/m.141185 type:complete len:215 (+) Transcript_60340:199-843(+)
MITCTRGSTKFQKQLHCGSGTGLRSVVEACFALSIHDIGICLLLQESPAICQPLFTKCTPQRQGHSNVQLLQEDLHQGRHQVLLSCLESRHVTISSWLRAKLPAHGDEGLRLELLSEELQLGCQDVRAHLRGLSKAGAAFQDVILHICVVCKNHLVSRILLHQCYLHNADEPIEIGSPLMGRLHLYSISKRLLQHLDHLVLLFHVHWKNAAPAG